MRRATAKDRQRRYIASGIIVKQLHNEERTGYSECFKPPPPRTGKLDAFMDEVESAAAGLGLQWVLVESVFNKFLPAKLERRGYRRIDEGFGYPHFLKTVSAIPEDV